MPHNGHAMVTNYNLTITSQRRMLLNKLLKLYTLNSTVYDENYNYISNTILRAHKIFESKNMTAITVV